MKKHMQLFMEADGAMGSGGSQPTAPVVESQAATTPVETTGTQPAESHAESPEQGTTSVGGQLKLIHDERTGRNRVEFAGVNTEHTPQEPQPPIEQQLQTQQIVTPPVQTPVQVPDADLPRLDAILTQPQAQTQQIVQGGLINPAPVQEYTLPELSAAMQLGLVDETRVPEAYKQAYINAKEAGNANTAQQTATATQEDSAVEAQAFYSRVAEMANEQAMREIGITQEELDTAEYTDDQNIIAKYRAYRTAQDNNRMRILSDVNRLKEQEMQRQNDSHIALNEIANFAQQIKEKEPNFEAIDKFMLERVNTMPYADAARIVPILERVHKGTVGTADLPALQKYFEESRMAFYAQKTGVGIAPQVVTPARPAYTETPGNGAEIPAERTPTSVLGQLSYRDKIKAIGQMFQPKE